MIDLHTHSTMSDGSLTPESLASLAKSLSVTAIALTDHDTTRGCRRFLTACEQAGIRGIAGVELSAEYKPGTLHMLGYLALEQAEALEPILSDIQAGRETRNREMVAILNRHGVDLSMAQVEAEAGDGMVGRPHFAAAMVRAGIVKDGREAFRRYLGKTGIAYRPRFRLPPDECIALIHAHGGVAVLAHPFSLGLSRRELREYVKKLANWGLDGIEVLYPEHAHYDQNFYRYLAHRYKLLITGGSDFHGAANPWIRLGRGKGNLHVANSLLAPIDRRLQLKNEVLPC